MLSRVLSLVFLAFSLLCVRTVAAQQPVPQTARAMVVVEPAVVELGPVGPASRNPAHFLLRNLTSQPIVVKAAIPNCKCTDISNIVGSVIAAGGTLALDASLKAPRAPGEKDAKVTIVFEGQVPPVVATIKGDVQLPVLADPPYCDALKENVRGVVKLRSKDGATFRILRSGGKEPAYLGFDPKSDAPRSEYTLLWDLSGKSCEQMPIWWFVFTDHPGCPSIPLRVRDECTGSKADSARYERFWIVKDQLVDAERASFGKPAEVSIDLEHYNPPAKGQITNPRFREVQSVRSLVAHVTATLVSVTPHGADGAVVVVKLEPIAGASGPIEGELELVTATGSGRIPFTLLATPESSAK
ncbi:MAG: DUF1573 domain-containing protein [Phycisphaerales bacterium]|nr:DUF1573 domain-containing protein [Phycisphaerales bacterium]